MQSGKKRNAPDLYHPQPRCLGVRYFWAEQRTQHRNDLSSLLFFPDDDSLPCPVSARRNGMAQKKTPPKKAPQKNPRQTKALTKTASDPANRQKTVSQKEPVEPRKLERKAFPVVGIGASAGGLEPLEAFFANMPTDKPAGVDMAFVVIQHLNPQHKSIIGEILKKDTNMPIKEIRDGMTVEPNSVYFNPPDREVGIFQGAFHLMEPTDARHTRMPIDFFFRSLAQDLEEKAICIVLSGTGSDGTLGLEAVKGAGGMTMAQAEEQAKYPFMPRSAIDTGLVDYVLPVEQMPPEIIRYVRHPYLEDREKELPADKHYQSFLQKILMLVRANTKHDFSHYKQTTIRRRLGRRMAVHRIENIADYFRYLQQNPAEIQILFKDLVICVTNFFRDPEAFKTLEAKVIPEILAHKSLDDPIRVWVPGCGSGEEALSIAMILAEAMERTGQHHLVQIFATDIDPDAIDKARVGGYPDSIAADVSPERLKRFFVKRDARYKIKQEIREMVVYAVQNLISDPPFSRLDLISCRNVLIYLDNDLQKQILPLFHFTLNPTGYLFLGTSETIGGAADLFAPVDTKWKIFQRKGPVHHHLTDYPALTLPAAAVVVRAYPKEEAPREINIRTIMERIVLEEYAPPTILINQRYDVLFLQGDTSKFLGMPKGEPSYNLFNLAHEDLRPKLLTVLHRAVSEKKSVIVESIPFKQSEGKIGYLNLTVRPLAVPGAYSLFLMVFEELTPPPQIKKGRRKAPATPEEESRMAVLEHELQATKEYLQTTVEELEASNEELKSTNEELQSTNEELQSTNEELETAKEELQSTNEELVTVNSELNGKIDELTEVNNDINNLLASTEIGTVFLDRDMHIKRFTPAATRLFNLIPADVGRSIKDISPKTENENLWQDAEEVLHSLQVKEMEVKSLSGEVYATRILPYRTRENVIDGVVLTFIDISAQYLLSLAQNFAESIVDTVREPLLVLDGDLKVISANQAFYRVFHTSKPDTLDQPIYELGDGQWDIPRLRELLEEIIPKNTSFQDFEVAYDFPRIGHKTMLLNARCIPAAGEQATMILLALEEVTEHRK
jgi:two-component system CheB/CheR fusion protein